MRRTPRFGREKEAVDRGSSFSPNVHSIAYRSIWQEEGMPEPIFIEFLLQFVEALGFVLTERPD